MSEAVLRTIDRWRSDPVEFAHDVLGIDPWVDDDGFDSQASVLRSNAFDLTSSTRSGHKTGKSTDAAVIALWNYCLFPGVRVILTAPTWRQIEEVIWREVGILYRRAKKRGYDLGGKLNERPDRGLRGDQDREVWGFSTDDPDRFSGISGARVVYLLDEAAGIDDAIDEAIEGNRAGGAQKHCYGNPTRTEGFFFRSHHEESDAYKLHHLNSERTPNARGLGAPIPGVATKDWVERKRKQWHPHETHPIYGYRVRGDFPAQASHSVFGLAAVEAAIRRWVPVCPEVHLTKRLEVGLDCARFGDDSNVVFPRRGPYGYAPTATGGQDSIQVAGWARKVINDLRTPTERSRGPKPRVKVDVIGIGAGVYDQLKASAPEIEVVPVNGSSSPTQEPSDGDPGYVNLRAEVHFAAAEWTETAMLPPDRELRSELLAVRYKFDKLGRVQVEEKDALKERIGRSPDRMDAMTLSVHDPKVWSPRPLRVGALSG